MRSIIIITENILNEIEIETKLKNLNCEVLCTTERVFLRKNLAVLDYFDGIVFSNNISDRTIEQFMGWINYDNSVFRLTSKKNANDTSSENSIVKTEITMISIDVSVEELREVLAKSNNGSIRKNREKFLEQEITSKFSKKEKLLFELLSKEQGDIISREDICNTLWGEATKSRLSSLSSLSKKINIKMKQMYNINDGIKCHWGKGYSISNEVLKLAVSQI